MKTYISGIVLVLMFSFVIFSCGPGGPTTELSQKIRAEFDHSLITTTQPNDETIRLTFRADDTLRNLDEDSELARNMATFVVNNFEKGDNIATVEIIIDEPSMSATTTAATRKTIRIQTDSL